MVLMIMPDVIRVRGSENANSGQGIILAADYTHLPLLLHLKSGPEQGKRPLRRYTFTLLSCRSQKGGTTTAITCHVLDLLGNTYFRRHLGGPAP